MSYPDEVWEKRAEHHYGMFTRHPIWYSAALFAALVFIILILTVIGNAFGIVSVFWNAEKAKITNPARVQQRVYQPENTFAQVAFFHNTCRDTVSQYNQWKNNEDQYQTDLQTAKFTTDPLQKQQAIQSLTTDEQNVVGAANQLQNTAQDYNSRSAQYTANVFKDNSLPYRIEPPNGASNLMKWTPPNCG